MAPDAEVADAPDHTVPATPWALYLLACAGGRSYVGISTRPEARYAAHRAGRGGAFTRANPPERCVRIVWFDCRRAAASLEVRLKSVSRARKWHWFAEFPETQPERAATLELGLARLQARTNERGTLDDLADA